MVRRSIRAIASFKNKRLCVGLDRARVSMGVVDRRQSLKDEGDEHKPGKRRTHGAPFRRCSQD